MDLNSPEIFPHLHGHFIFDEDSQTIQWGGKSLFNKYVEKLFIHRGGGKNLDPYFILNTKINLRWIMNILKVKTIKFPV